MAKRSGRATLGRGRRMKYPALGPFPRTIRAARPRQYITLRTNPPCPHKKRLKNIISILNRLTWFASHCATFKTKPKLWAPCARMLLKWRRPSLFLALMPPYPFSRESSMLTLPSIFAVTVLDENTGISVGAKALVTVRLFVGGQPYYGD